MSERAMVATSVNREIDFETGEVKSEVLTHNFKAKAEPAYVKMYIEDLCSIKGVADADQSLLRQLLAKLDYEGYVTLSPRSREVICKTLEISQKTLRNRLARLSKSGLIKSTSTNEYMVNPNYFARGQWKDVCEQRKKFELIVKYSEDKGREIQLELIAD